ncbi:MAG: peptidoglycan-associated lipoprotein Pal [Pseudomonadota bacterium]
MDSKLGIAVIASAALISACASTPPEEPAPVVVAEPEPAPEPVVEAPAEPVYSGPLPGSVQDFADNAGDRVFFEVDQYNLDAEDRAALQRQATWLGAYPGVTVLVGGNADERGTREYNLALGARRASAVKDYLVSLGVDPARIETISYGKERPLDPASTEAAWNVNRNAQTQIVSGAVTG